MKIPLPTFRRLLAGQDPYSSYQYGYQPKDPMEHLPNPPVTPPQPPKQKKKKEKRSYSLASMIAVSLASVILVFQIVFDNLGILNSMLNAIGVSGQDWLHSEHAFGVLVLLYIWKNCGYNIVLLLAGLNAIPKELYEAAKVDGAGRKAMLLRITLPLMVPTFFFVFVISIINSFKSFREAFLLGGSHPHESIYMLQHFFNNNFQNLNYQRLSVAALLVFVIIFTFVFFLYLAKRRLEVDRK